MIKLKRYISFSELKSNSNSTPKTQQVSQYADVRLKDFINLLRSSLLPKSKDKMLTKGNKFKNG